MIPDYQTLMLPLLRLVADKKEHKYRDLIESLAIEFQLSAAHEKEHLDKAIAAFEKVGKELGVIKK